MLSHQLIQGLERDEKLLYISHENNLETIQILLSAYPYPQYQQKCEEMGAEYFFDKSTEFHRVQEVLTELAVSAQKDLDENVPFGSWREMQLKLNITNWAENPFM